MLLYPIFASAAKKALAYRGDGAPSAPNYYPWTWKDLAYEPFSFKCGKWVLRGFKYSKKGVKEFKGLVTFFHGLGSGHYAYVNLCNMLAQAGYLVYAYDNPGSGLSEGRVIGSLSEAPKAQKAFYEYLDKHTSIKDLPRYAIGHSWGGFTALCALQEQYRVKKVVSISGFDSVKQIFLSAVPIAKLMKCEIWLYQTIHYGKLGRLSGLELMKNTNKEVLYIQGEQDKVVNFKDNGLRFQQELKDKKNIHFLFKKDSAHNPYWTKEVEDYYLSCVEGKDSIMSLDRPLGRTFKDDWWRSVDPSIEKAILDFLAS